jgi:hypothetical protein
MGWISLIKIPKMVSKMVDFNHKQRDQGGIFISDLEMKNRITQ